MNRSFFIVVRIAHEFFLVDGLFMCTNTTLQIFLLIMVYIKYYVNVFNKHIFSGTLIP